MNFVDAVIFVTNTIALWKLASADPRERMKAGVIGMIGQPFWFWSLIADQDWILCGLAVVFTFNWTRIILKNYWLAAKDTMGLGPIR